MKMTQYAKEQDNKLVAPTAAEIAHNYAIDKARFNIQ